MRKEFISPIREKRTLLMVLCVLTALAVFFQVSVLYHEFNVIFSNLSHAQLVTNEIWSAPQVIFELASFFLIHLFLYGIYIAFIYTYTICLLNYFKLNDLYSLYLGVTLWFWMTTTIIVVNQIYFPQSRFAFILRALPSLTPTQLMNVYMFLAGGVVLLGIPLVFELINKIIHWPRLAISVMMVFSISIGIPLLKENNFFVAETKKPNIIIIGIDSLRPDFIKNFAPHLDDFLEKSVLFSSAITTLGRTYPAWLSILSGDYPKTINIRDDLSPVAPPNDLLSKLLRRDGYTTIYSTDDSRFSNIDESFGFDENISPPYGISNFILGEVNDFPLTNFLINTTVGKKLFPYSYVNRAAFATYDPDEYTHYLTKAIQKMSDKPLFIAVHFNLPHFPYLNAKSKAVSSRQFADVLEEEYTTSITQADQQFNTFLKFLEKKHFLDNAIVVVLTDHGESLAKDVDRITQPQNYTGNTIEKKLMTQLTQKVGIGHGTDILAMSQNKIFMAFRLYGKKPSKKNNRFAMVSLIDVAPTILDYLNLKPEKMDGISLLPFILNPDKKLPQRKFFIETGLTPDSLMSAKPDVGMLLKEAIHYHQLNLQTGQLSINALLLPDIIAGKQRAILDYPWLLVVYPKKNSLRPVLVNVNSLQWTTDMQSAFAKKTPVELLYKSLLNFYGNELPRHFFNRSLDEV